MVKKYYRLLDYPEYFRFGFFFLLIAAFTLSEFVFEQANNLYILYIFAGIFLGIGFYQRPIWLIILLDVLIVYLRYFLIPEWHHSFATFLTYMVTYLLITFITVGLMKGVQKVKNDRIELTTALSNILDSRDSYTSHHSENVAKVAQQIATEMKLSKEKMDAIAIGCLLHDIGKIGIAEEILNKPEKLTAEEYSIIKNHPIIGYDMLKHVSNFRTSGVLDIILYHHERYDGKGYPYGLKGEEIPLLARITAVADAYDAMSSKRVYRGEFDLNYILSEIWENKGTQFDPQIVDIFLSFFD
ncbi:HD-GYP domain-containing protein [Bacillus sp. DNRA2]|uniref:HD-GYP domain-containing protein n=1 Tax=Bacillus sp. DNRA2 TaxID=2723053 RepID=UPI00145EB2B9|nr:HD-GYP domain-containing protein [Bacillus sp. DNRA2]NMD70971.1 HD-GYP domain-containing protein [Bacillus sp. DNRA2]